MASDKRIVFHFEGDTRDLESALRGLRKDTDRASKSAESYGKSAKRSFRQAKLGAIGVATAVAATAAGFAVLISKVIEFGRAADKIAKSAKAVGATAEEFQVTSGALGLLGISSEQAEMSMKKLGLRIGQVASGAGGPAKDAFKELGLTAKELESLPLPERMALLADRVSEFGSQTKRAALLNAIFEESGLAMAGAFGEGGDAVRVAADKIRAAGIVSNESAAQSEEMTDSVALLKTTWQALVYQVLEPFIPVVIRVAGYLSNLIVELQKTGEIKKFGAMLVDVFLRFVAPAAAYMAEVFIVSLASMKPAMLGIQILGMRLKAVFHTVMFDMESAEKMISKIQGAEEDWMQATKDLGAVQEAASEGRRNFLQELKDIQESLGDGASMADLFADSMENLRGEKPFDDDTVFGADLDAVPKFLQDTQRAIAAVGSSLQSLFGQVSANIASAIRDANAEIRDIDKALEEEADASARRRLQSRKRALKEELKAQREAALAAFVGGKLAAIAQATIQGAVAVVRALAEGGPFAGPALATAVGIAAGIQIAAIAAEPPPSFHAGGMVGLGAPDEISARLLRSEAVLSAQGVRAAGGAEGIRDLNRGSPGGAQPVVTVFKVRSRTVDAMVSDNLRTRQGPLVDALRAAQPRALGRHNPYSSS